MPTLQSDDELVRATLAAVAPGTELRDGLERILRGRTGALIVLGNDKVVETVSTGGFPLDIEFSATRLRELAKMDGAHRLRPRGHPHPARRHPAGARPAHRDQRVRHPAPHRRAGGQADRLPGDLGEPVDAHHRPLHRGPPGRARGLQRHPVARQPGPADARALQVAPRRGHRHAVRPRDRGPRHRARRRQRAAAPRDGAPHQRRDRRLRRASSAPTAGCSASSSRSSPAACRDDRELVIRDYLPEAKAAYSLEEAIADLEAIDSTELLDLAAGARAHRLHHRRRRARLRRSARSATAC